MDSSHDHPMLDKVGPTSDTPAQSVDGPLTSPDRQGDEDDPVIDLAEYYEPETPRLTLILPDEARERPVVERLALVTDDDEPAGELFDSSASTSFNDWAEQVSSEFTAPGDEEPDVVKESMNALIARDRNSAEPADSLWAVLKSVPAETEMAANVASEPPPNVAAQAMATEEAEAERLLESIPASGGPMLPPPPERIGVGMRVDAGRKWQPANPFAGLTLGVLKGFRWGRMWRAAAATAAGGGVFLLAFKRLFA